MTAALVVSPTDI